MKFPAVFIKTLIFFILIGNNVFPQVVKMGVPSGHTNSINVIQYSPDGSIIATASSDHTIKIWEAASGKMIHSLEGHNESVSAIEFSRDGKLLVSASTDNTVRIWDVFSGSTVKVLTGTSRWIKFTGFSNDRKYLMFSSNDSIIRVYETKKWELIYEIYAKSYIYQAGFTPDGNSILTINSDKFIQLWNVRNGKLKTANSEKISKKSSVWPESFKFSHDGKYFVTMTSLGEIRYWNLKTLKIENSFSIWDQFNTSAHFFDISPDDRHVVFACNDGKVRVYDLKTAKMVSSLTINTAGEYTSCKFASFSEDGKYLIASNYDYVLIFNAADFRLIRTIEAGEHRIFDDDTEPKFSPDAKNLAVCRFYTVVVFEISSGKTLQILGENKKIFLSACFSPDGKQILTSSNDKTIRAWETGTGKISGQQKMYFISSIAGYSPNGKAIIVKSGWGEGFEFWNSDLTKRLGCTYLAVITAASISSDGSFAAIGTDSGKVIIYEINSDKILHSIPAHDAKINSIKISKDGKYVVTASDDGYVKVIEIESEKTILNVKCTHKATDADFSPDDQYIVLLVVSTSFIYEIKTARYLGKFQGCRDMIGKFSPDGKFLLVPYYYDELSLKLNLAVYDIFSGNKSFDLDDNGVSVDDFFYSPDGKYIITCTSDFVIRICNASDGKLVRKLEGHSGKVYRPDISPDGKYLVSPSLDGSFIIWDLESGKIINRTFILEDNNYLTLNSTGLFDATPGAMDMMYWTKGLEIIEFNQLKDRFWVPSLWQKTINNEPLPDIRGLDDLKLQPKVEFGDIKNGKITVRLIKRDGGYGKTGILINGKEIITDARGSNFDTSASSQVIYIDLKDHPYLVSGENTITVKSSTSDGFVQGRGASLVYEYDKEVPADVHFYGIVIGISEYINKDINLKFTESDAISMSHAIRIGAENLFGKEKVQIFTLTSKTGSRPDKNNIRSVFDSVARKARAEDIILVYLSGHGITYGGESGDFYFLTADATASNSEAYTDEAIRKNNTFSTSEITELLKKIAALKQVMIIDACGSGKAVENLVATRNVESSQIKAIDRMKDRTGMFVISGCASDAVSYEASRFGQGLLTYSLLQAMKGAKLRDGKYIDVNELLSYAREEVPKLARGIGGIQTPQLLVPRGGSFDIGLLEVDDCKKIPLNNPKPVFVRSVLMDADKARDVLNLSKAIDDFLNETSMKGSGSKIVFLDSREFPGAYQVSGIYTQKGDTISLKLNITGQQETEYRITADSKQDLLDKVFEKISLIE